MTKSFSDLLREARAEIREVSPGEADAGRGARRPARRRPRDHRVGARATSPAPPTSPRATSSSRSRRRRPTATRPSSLYCAGGMRSLFAAQTLAAMGYTERDLHERRLPGLEVGGPAVDAAGRPVRGAEAALQPPPAHPGGRRRGPGEAAGLEGAVHRRRRPGLARPCSTSPRPAWAPSASSTSTSSTSPTCSARSSTPPTAWAEEDGVGDADASAR